MPERCFIWSCSSRGKIPGIHYFAFGSRKNAWLEVLGVQGADNISPRNLLCSKHFDRTDIIFPNTPTGIARLRQNAMPKYFLKNKREPENIPPEVEPPTKKSSGIALRLLDEDHEQPSTSSIEIVDKNPGTPVEVENQELSSSTDSVGLKHTPKKNRRLVKKMHSYCITTEEASNKLKTQQSKIKVLSYKYKVEKQKNKRLRKKVGHLRDIVQDIKKKELLSRDACNILEKSFSGVPFALMKRMLTNSRRGKVGRQKFDEVLRSFAMTLQFYSSKAYEYVRRTFNLALPSQRIIRSWLSNISCGPGFSQPAFDSLKVKVSDNMSKGHHTICSLMLDEMAIKKYVDTIDGKPWGYVDFGTNLKYDNNTDYASEALVLMVVALNGQWKLPIAFFLVHSLTGEEKANIVRESLIKLHECGVIITSLTSDGPRVNFTMVEDLGAKTKDLDNIQPYFHHPVDNSKIYVILDACHMVKLVRNNWSNLMRFVDPDGEIVDFNYIKMLHQLQEQEGLRFGTKLRQAHMDWRKQKMKVNLAVQTLSESVASALEFLMLDIKDPRFKDAAPTIKFIRLIDKVFDLLNSRNPMTVRMKMPIKVENEDLWMPVFEDALNYCCNCKDLQGTKIIKTPQKTPFIGLVLSIKSVIGIYETYVKCADRKLRYLLTYKLSQDHLELFFCSMRSRNGWNNNPSAIQFCRSYKRLLLHHDIKNMSGNCVAQDSTNVLYTTGTNKTVIPLDNSDMHIIKKYSLELNESYLHDHDYSMPINPSLNDLSENVVAYVTGYAVRMAMKLIKCPTCVQSLHSDCKRSDKKLSLLLRKKWGQLIVPSDDAIKICTLVEQKLRNVLHVTNRKIPSEPEFFNYFVLNVFTELLYRPLFTDLDSHNIEYLTLAENHKSRIIKSLCVSYMKIRLFNLAKSQSYEAKGDLVRKKLSKLILFHHQ